MEQQGFEVQDVEAWRRHYALTTKLWCDRLTARRAEAVAHGGRPALPHLGRLSGGRVAVLLARHAAHLPDAGLEERERPAPLPPTRADLYR